MCINTYKQFACKYSTRILKRRSKKHLECGFSLLEVLIALVVVSILMVATAAVVSSKLKASTNVSRYISTCIVKDAANLTTVSCLGAIKGCQGGVKNDCSAIFSYVDNYPTPTYKLAKAICDQNGEIACNFLMDKCNENYANCDMTGSNDIDYYLGLLPTDINKGRAYIETLGAYYYNQGMTNFRTFVVSKCGGASPPRSNTACRIANFEKVNYDYTFDTNTRAQYNEKDPINATLFDGGVVKLLSPASALCWTMNGTWDSNAYGQFGDANTGGGVTGGHTFNSISAGSEHNCGIDNTGLPGNAWCWGRNNYGQLGIGNTTNKNLPVQVNDGHILNSISTGNSHTCGLDTSGNSWCWGFNNYGQLGIGNNTNKTTPVQVSGYTFNSISSGVDYTCGVDTSNNAWCWGFNGNGQLGIGNTSNKSTPNAVSGASFSSISTGYYHTCGIDTSGNAYCWGRNDFGQLGNGSTANSTVPVSVSGGHIFTSIAVAQFHTCGLDTSGNAYCWGRNNFGQLGIGIQDLNNHTIPEAVGGGKLFTSITKGYNYSCGINTSGNAYCWGQYFGSPYTPIIQSSSNQFAALSALNLVICGIRSTAGVFTHSYVTTTWQNSLQNVGLIDSVDIDETVIDTTTPYQSTTRWLVSFDGTTWGKLSAPVLYKCQWTSKTTDLSTFDFLNNGNTSAEIENYLNTCSLPGTATTLYFAVDLISADGHVLPQVNNIQVKYYK
ncbi:MAG: prepilin-type N-terminal cleavage/methylation domain-containing protein [bacterium]